MKNSGLTQVNVFFKVAEPLYSEITSTSKKIAKNYSVKHHLDGKIKIPHLSLYLFALPQKNLPRLIKKAKEVTKDMKQVNLEVEDMIATENNVVMLHFKKNKKLYQYHLKVLNAFNPLREGAQRKRYSNNISLKSLNNKHLKYIRSYGCRFILDEFRPHIHLVVTKENKTAQKIANKYKKKFAARKSCTEKLCIIEDSYETSNAKRLIFSQPLPLV